MEAEPTLDAIVQDYLKACASGVPPQPSEWLARYPRFAAELTEFFAAQKTLNNVHTPAQPPTPVFTTDQPTLAPGQAPHEVTANNLPRHFGDFELREEIARGGMGVVFKARQISLGRDVALKMILAGELASAAEVARFRTEAEAAANLDHPHILPIYEVGEHQGERYFSMKLIDGGSLADRLCRGPMDPRAVARLMERVARAVHFAHQRGILHRDLKPGNVLLDSAGQPFVADFGLAKRIEDRSQVTQSGAMVGTPSYMAPEQARAEKTLTTAADTYALGAILYELLAGRPPFVAPTALQIVMQVLEKDPEPPSRIRPGVPRDLETICLKCLYKEPHKRYASAEALAEDLARYLEDRPIQARPVGRPERTRRWCRRNPVLATFSVAAAMAVIVAGVLLYHERSQTLANLQRAEDAERESRLREAQALLGQARGISSSRRPGQRFKALDALTRAAAIGRELGQPPDWFAPLRNVAIAALALPDLDVTYSWPGFPEGTQYAELNDDFELYARTTETGACSIRRVVDDTEVAHLPEVGEPTLARFGPGQLLAVHGSRSNRLQLWDVSNGNPRRILKAENVELGWCFRSHDGLLLFPHLDGTIHVFETANQQLRRLAPQNMRTPHIDIHPSQPLFAACSYYSAALQLRDLKSGAVLTSQSLPWRGSFNCSWSPDGRTLAVTEGDGGRVQLYALGDDRRSLRLERTLQTSESGGISAQFNPAADRLVVRGWAQRVQFFDVNNGKLLFSLPSQPVITPFPVPPRFDATGRRLAATRVGDKQERIGIWSVADSRKFRRLGRPQPLVPGMESRPAIHPGGRLVAQVAQDGLVLSDLESGRELRFLDVPGKNACVCFDGSGNLLSTGSAGLFRWPVQEDASRPGRFNIGPRETLPFHPGTTHIAVSRAGRVVAQSMFSGYGMKQYAGGWFWSAPGARTLD